MQNVGEEIVGEYLKVILDCEFVDYNVQFPNIQGDIDVVGIDVNGKKLYVCEVATHLQGLQYPAKKDGKYQPDNVNRFLKKFRKNIPYADKYFPEHEKHFMIWSPIVKTAGPTAKHNAMQDLEEVKARLGAEFDCDIEAIVNEEYQKRLEELRAYARKETKELKSPILRTMQIEEHLKKYVQRLAQ